MLLIYPILIKLILFNRNILYCKLQFLKCNDSENVYLIGTFCIVNLETVYAMLGKMNI